jgi:hypothetical protein
MDMAAKLSAKYTLADVFKQLFSPSARWGGCRRGNPVSLILRAPSAVTPAAYR